jgi:hypothetical protein
VHAKASAIDRMASVRPLCLVVLAIVAISRTACAPNREGTRRALVPPTPTADPEDEPNEDPHPPAAGPVGASGNHGIRVFDEAKKEIGRIYAAAGQRTDLYCGCSFLVEPGHGMRVDLTACGYVAARDRARAERIEWEHAVPASAFGHTFAEWREGHPKCVDSHGTTTCFRWLARSTACAATSPWASWTARDP